MRASLEALAGHADGLQGSCEDFLKASRGLEEKREQNRQLQGNMGTLLELLEVPQLMETCVRNGSYDEALDLEAFVHKLGLLHSELPVARSPPLARLPCPSPPPSPSSSAAQPSVGRH